MPYRVVPPRSDRGSIKDIQKAVTDFLQEDPNLPPTPAELRIKALYEHALVLRDQALIDSLGLIVMGGAPKDPVSVMRHREYVKEISARLGVAQIEDAKKDIDALINDESATGPMEMRVAKYKQTEARNTILSEEGVLIKNASRYKGGVIKRSFWRSK